MHIIDFPEIECDPICAEQIDNGHIRHNNHRGRSTEMISINFKETDFIYKVPRVNESPFEYRPHAYLTHFQHSIQTFFVCLFGRTLSWRDVQRTFLSLLYCNDG
jgi:hypothetical protein